jgi:hypothetical protein
MVKELIDQTPDERSSKQEEREAVVAGFKALGLFTFMIIRNAF